MSKINKSFVNSLIPLHLLSLFKSFSLFLDNAPSSTRRSTLPSSSSRPHSTIHVDSVPATTTTVHRPSLLQVPSHLEIPLPPRPPPSHLSPSPSHHLIPLLPPLPSPPPPPRPLLPRPSIIVPRIGHAPLFSPPLHISSRHRPNRCPFHGPVPLIHGPPRGPTRLPIRSPPSHGSHYVPPLIGASPGTPPLISSPHHSTPPPLIHTMSSSSNHIHRERGVLVSPTRKDTSLLQNPPNTPLMLCTTNASLLTPPPPPLISIANAVQPPPLVSDRVHVPVPSSMSLLRSPLHNNNDHHQSQSQLSRNSIGSPFTSSAQTGKDHLPLVSIFII